MHESTRNKPTLNSTCYCISLDQAALEHGLAAALGSAELAQLVGERCPYLFSAQPVFISRRHAAQMAAVVQAVESVLALPSCRQAVLADAAGIARDAPGARGVFLGFDFHLHGDRVGLIEINTNAGGAMLNAVAARAHRACCLDAGELALATAASASFEQHIIDMFMNEWRLAGRKRPLRTIAIVDTEPRQQYLYPEFLLFRQLFERHGLQAVIADPSALRFAQGVLSHEGVEIDMVYNRLTDFMLVQPPAAALRAACLARAAVVTPHPHAHALYADKRNLALLSDPAWLEAQGVPLAEREILLAHVLPTERVSAERGASLWRRRRQLFFKPAAGYGSRAAYRGDKLTTRVWQEILAGDYVAQAIMLPGERIIGGSAAGMAAQALKFDLRCYAYGGQVQFTAARLYQGQTTNFRTPGGGFAPVYSLADADIACRVHDERLSPLPAPA